MSSLYCLFPTPKVRTSQDLAHCTKVTQPILPPENILAVAQIPLWLYLCLIFPIPAYAFWIYHITSISSYPHIIAYGPHILFCLKLPHSFLSIYHIFLANCFVWAASVPLPALRGQFRKHAGLPSRTSCEVLDVLSSGATHNAS